MRLAADPNHWISVTAPLATERHELVVPAVGAAQAQEAVCQDATFEVRVELVFDELRQAGAGGLFGLGEKALRVLLHRKRYSVVCSGRWRS